MSYNTWHDYGYGICTDDLKEEISLIKLMKLVQIAPKLYEKVKGGIREGKLDPPENCSNSWCETEELNNEKDVRFTPFSRNELDLMYAACMAYGNKLFEMAREIPNEPQIADLLSKKAKESWNMAIKITNYLDN